MEEYKKGLARTFAETGALFFSRDLVLKDGRPTPYFINMAMFRTGRLALEMGGFFAGMMVSSSVVEETDIIIGPSYKGSTIAAATAIALWKDYGIELPFDYDRKEAKTHGEGSVGKRIFVNQTLFDGCRIFVVDDVATSMGTKYELLEKIGEQARDKGMKYRVIGVGIGIDREQTTAVHDSEGNVELGKRGDNAIQKFELDTAIPVIPVAGIREVVEFLYSERIPVMVRGEMVPIDDETKADFDEYLETYGVGD